MRPHDLHDELRNTIFSWIGRATFHSCEIVSRNHIMAHNQWLELARALKAWECCGMIKIIPHWALFSFFESLYSKGDLTTTHGLQIHSCLIIIDMHSWFFYVHNLLTHINFLHYTTEFDLVPSSLTLFCMVYQYHVTKKHRYILHIHARRSYVGQCHIHTIRWHWRSSYPEISTGMNK